MGYLLKRVRRDHGAAIAVDPQDRLCRLTRIDMDIAGGVVRADAFDPWLSPDDVMEGAATSPV